MQPSPEPRPIAGPTPTPAYLRGNPKGVRARATDHAVRRFAERALGIVLDEALSDAAAMAALAHRGVNVRAVRASLAHYGGLGVAHGANAVVVNGLKLVIQDRAVVTVLARVMRPDAPASGPSMPMPQRRERTVLDAEYQA